MKLIKKGKDKNMKAVWKTKWKDNKGIGSSHQELFITMCFENIWYTRNFQLKLQSKWTPLRAFFVDLTKHNLL